MSVYTAQYDDDLQLHDAYGSTGYGVVEADTTTLIGAFGSSGYGHVFETTVAFHTVNFGYAFQGGAALADTLGVHDTQAVQAFLGFTLVNGVSWGDSFIHAVPAAIVDALGLDAALVVTRAITVLQRLGLHDALAPNTRQGLLLAEAIALNDAVLAFFGRSIADVIHFHPQHIPTAQFVRSLSATVGLHALLQGSLYWQVTVPDELILEDNDLVQMLYAGDPLADGFLFSIATLDPGGDFTTWAINTRTGAVSEYQNFAFNSFCQIGVNYYGANANGLFLINNNTDNGENIIADLKSGLLSIGGSRFTQLDQIYLGIDTNSTGRDWVLKLITPNNLQPDKIFTYYFAPKGLQTTRVNVGKGFRTRYMQWELVVPGQDFDLDNIEFVPVIAKRRV